MSSIPQNRQELYLAVKQTYEKILDDYLTNHPRFFNTQMSC